MFSLSNIINNLKGEINKTYYEDNKIFQVDPRVENNPLPNDSKITSKFGALAYITDTYPGYVWRNGSWYKIKNNLSFKPHSAQRITNFKKNININRHICSIDKINVKELKKCDYINDAFVPIKHYDNRYFICIPDTMYQNKYYCTLYIPHHKATCTLALWPNEINNLKYES